MFATPQCSSCERAAMAMGVSSNFVRCPTSMRLAPRRANVRMGPGHMMGDHPHRPELTFIGRLLLPLLRGGLLQAA